MTGRRDSRSTYEPDPRDTGILDLPDPGDRHDAGPADPVDAQPANPFANPYASPPEQPRVRRRDLRNRPAGTPPPVAPPAAPRSEETQTFPWSDVRALREPEPAREPDPAREPEPGREPEPASETEQYRETERERVDRELAAQKAALDATLRRPRDNRGNRRRRTAPPTASVPVASTAPPTAPRGIPAVPFGRPSAPAPGAPAPATPAPAAPTPAASAPAGPAPATLAPAVPAPAGPAPAAASRPAPQGMRTVTPARSAGQRRVGPILAMLLVVLIGFGLVVFGGLRATYLAPPAELTATLNNSSRVPVLVTRIGMLGLEGPRTRVTVRSTSSSSTVFLGIGRAADVDAYLGQVNRMDLVGVNAQDQVLTRISGTQPSLPDPASADVWVVSVRAKGAATVVWPQTEGQWRLIVATDGKAAAPGSVEISWSGRPAETLPPVLIAIGFVLMVAGGVSLVMISSRSGLDAGGPPTGSIRTGRQTSFREGARL